MRNSQFAFSIFSVFFLRIKKCEKAEWPPKAALRGCWVVEKELFGRAKRAVKACGRKDGVERAGVAWGD